MLTRGFEDHGSPAITPELDDEVALLADDLILALCHS